MAITYATWNPADKWANITLSGGNLTATTTAAAWDAVRTTISKSSGKWYFEMSITANNLGICGIGKSTATLASYLGSDANWYGYYSTWQKSNSGLSAYWATYTTSDVIGVAMDMDAGQITFYKNNVSQGVAFTGITGSLFGMCSVINSGGTNSITANFWATALTYSPPAGFNAWLYTGTPDSQAWILYLFCNQ